jgi:predicted dehydrogenase
MLKIGLIGAGKIAETFHLPAWAQVVGAEVVALVDPRIDAAKKLGQEYGVCNIFSTIENMLSSIKLDAVDICSPHTFHADHAIRSLESGLHCIIEKPFTTDKKNARKIASEAEKHGLIVMCAQHQRFRPESILLKSKIDAGELGEIYHVNVEAMASRGIPVQVANSFTDKRLSGGGPLIDQGSHAIDIAWWLMGCPSPSSAFAVMHDGTAPKIGTTKNGAEWNVYNVEDFATAVIRFKNNKSITIRTSYFSNCAKDIFSCEILGTKGGMTWPDTIITKPYGNNVRRKKLKVETSSLASVAELSHFTSLIKGTDEAIIPLEQSVELVEIIDGLYESASTEQIFHF